MYVCYVWLYTESTTTDSSSAALRRLPRLHLPSRVLLKYMEKRTARICARRGKLRIVNDNDEVREGTLTSRRRRRFLDLFACIFDIGSECSLIDGAACTFALSRQHSVVGLHFLRAPSQKSYRRFLRARRKMWPPSCDGYAHSSLCRSQASRQQYTVLHRQYTVQYTSSTPCSTPPPVQQRTPCSTPPPSTPRRHRPTPRVHEGSGRHAGTRVV